MNTPPEKLDLENENFDQYKKRIKNKYGEKYDEYLNLLEAYGQFTELNSIAFWQLSPEEKKTFLNKTLKKNE